MANMITRNILRTIIWPYKHVFQWFYEVLVLMPWVCQNNLRCYSFCARGGKMGWVGRGGWVMGQYDLGWPEASFLHFLNFFIWKSCSLNIITKKNILVFFFLIMLFSTLYALTIHFWWLLTHSHFELFSILPI